MQFVAKSKYLRFSPYKLRPIVDVMRGKNVQYAMNLLATFSLRRAVPIRKVIQSAAANAKSLKNIDMQNLSIIDIRVDEGPTYKYYKPGAMGRANIQRKRSSHISVILEQQEQSKQSKGV